MRFNPPPNWPPPQDGWVPSPGWTPDPSWPPPPSGWQLWIDDETLPAGPTGGVAAPPPGRLGPPGRRTFVVGLAAVAAVIVAVGVAALILVPQTAADPPKSDEDQIREVLSGVVEAYNNADFNKYVSYFCPSERSGLGDASQLRQNRADTGRLSFDDISIDVTGDTAKVTATATVENEDEPDTQTVDFVKEDGRWMMLLFEDKCSA